VSNALNAALARVLRREESLMAGSSRDDERHDLVVDGSSAGTACPRSGIWDLALMRALSLDDGV
jgi:hypothetical protein